MVFCRTFSYWHDMGFGMCFVQSKQVWESSDLSTKPPPPSWRWVSHMRSLERPTSLGLQSFPHPPFIISGEVLHGFIIFGHYVSDEKFIHHI